MRTQQYGIIWKVTSTLLFVLTSMFIKLASEDAHHFQAVLARSLIPIPFLYFLAKRNNISLWGTRRKSLFTRGLYGALQLQFFIFAVMHLNLGDVTVIVSISPLFVALLSPWIAKEHSHRFVYFTIPIFLVGLCMIVQPSFDFTLLPVLAALSTALGVAIISLIIRNLRKTDSPFSIVFYFLFFSSLISFPGAIYYWQTLSTQTYVYLLLSALTALGAQLCMTQALRLEKASTLALFSYFGPVFGYVLGLFVLNETPNTTALLGTALVIACGIICVIFNSKKNKKQANPA